MQLHCPPQQVWSQDWLWPVKCLWQCVFLGGDFESKSLLLWDAPLGKQMQQEKLHP